MTRPAVFLDRDGVLIENRSDYVRSGDHVEFLPGSAAATQELSAAGYVIVVVTNQSVVGRGIISREEAERINQQIMDKVAAQGGKVDAAYMCPHHPDEGCACRKPAPGMVLQAAQELDLDLGRSFMVGDAISDVKAGRNAGVVSIMVRTGLGNEQARRVPEELPAGLLIVDDLPAAARYILGKERNGG
jgi:D-glycero-D-manno-heptose 1,7-bisphosphate phosphatase